MTSYSKMSEIITSPPEGEGGVDQWHPPKPILDERIDTPVRTMEIIHHWNDVPLPESWMSKILSHMEKYTPVRIMEL